LALNSAENRLRVLMVVRPLHQRIHLSRLSQEVDHLCPRPFLRFRRVVFAQRVCLRADPR
jgi:hypothetical protein